MPRVAASRKRIMVDGALTAFVRGIESLLL